MNKVAQKDAWNNDWINRSRCRLRCEKLAVVVVSSAGQSWTWTLWRPSSVELITRSVHVCVQHEWSTQCSASRGLSAAAGTCLHYRFNVFTARCYASAVLACMALSLSVRPSVTSRRSTKTAKRRITQTTPHDTPGTLVF